MYNVGNALRAGSVGERIVWTVVTQRGLCINVSARVYVLACDGHRKYSRTLR